MNTQEFKRNSMEKFEKFPAENSELFKYQTFFKDFEAKNEDRELSDDLGFQIVNKVGEVSIKNLKEFNLEKVYKKIDIDDKFVQMNNAFFFSGAAIEIPDNSEGELRIISNPDKSVTSKMIVLVGESSKLKLIKESYSKNENANTINEDVLVVSKPNSELVFSELQNYNSDSTYISNKIASCDRNSKVVWNIGLFGAKLNRSRTYNLMEGEGSEVEDLELTFGDKEQEFDAFSNLIHIGKSTTGKSLAKGVFKDESKSIFKGMIKIKENAKNASSYLASHGMLLSKTAKANAIPGLEIDTNDVKATHSASVSPIDEEKIFYMVARGIPETDAKRIIALGYFDPLIKSISSEEIRAKMRYLIESKWNNEKINAFDENRLKEFITEDAIKSGDIFEGHYKYR